MNQNKINPTPCSRHNQRYRNRMALWGQPSASAIEIGFRFAINGGSVDRISQGQHRHSWSELRVQLWIRNSLPEPTPPPPINITPQHWTPQLTRLNTGTYFQGGVLYREKRRRTKIVQWFLGFAQFFWFKISKSSPTLRKRKTSPCTVTSYVTRLCT